VYARAYPDQVTGMVLMDPPTPNLKKFGSPSAGGSPSPPR